MDHSYSIHYEREMWQDHSYYLGCTKSPRSLLRRALAGLCEDIPRTDHTYVRATWLAALKANAERNHCSSGQLFVDRDHTYGRVALISALTLPEPPQHISHSPDDKENITGLKYTRQQTSSETCSVDTAPCTDLLSLGSILCPPIPTPADPPSWTNTPKTIPDMRDDHTYYHEPRIMGCRNRRGRARNVKPDKSDHMYSFVCKEKLSPAVGGVKGKMSGDHIYCTSFLPDSHNDKPTVRDDCGELLNKDSGNIVIMDQTETEQDLDQTMSDSGRQKLGDGNAASQTCQSEPASVTDYSGKLPDSVSSVEEMDTDGKTWSDMKPPSLFMLMPLPPDFLPGISEFCSSPEQQQIVAQTVANSHHIVVHLEDHS